MESNKKSLKMVLLNVSKNSGWNFNVSPFLLMILFSFRMNKKLMFVMQDSMVASLGV